MTRRERIEHVLEDYGTNDLLSIVWSINGWDGSLEDMDWRWLDMAEIWSCYVENADNFEDFVRAAAFGDFNPHHNYWRWTWRGIESSSDPDIDLDEVADWIDSRLEDGDDLERIIGSYYADDFEFEEYETEPEEEDDDFDEDRMTAAEIAEAVAEYTPNQTDEQRKTIVRDAYLAERRMLDPVDVLEYIADQYPAALD